MSAAAAVLAIVVAAGETQSPLTAGLLATATESLGRETSIRLVEARDPTDADALKIERDLGAGAVITLVWREAAHLHVAIRFHVARTNRWTTRAIAFLPGDSLTERGRTLGLAVGSIWPEIPESISNPPARVEQTPRSRAVTEPRPEPAREPARQPAKELAKEPTNEPTNEPTKEPEKESAKQPAKEAPRPSAPQPMAVPADPVSVFPSPGRRIGIGVAAVGALGIGGPARGLGAGADGVLFVRGNLSIRVGISLRGGSLPELPGTDFVGSLAAGLEWWPVLQSNTQMWGLGIRADALALSHQVRATGVGEQTEAQSRFLPGGDLLAQASFRLGSRLDLLLGFGSEVVLGNTDIRKGTGGVTVPPIPPLRTVATIPPVRMLGQIGFRIGF